MYSGYGFRDYEIGDVDVVRHEGLFHLFHLTLPNHDYIAHAVSEDGLQWRRVKNALFIGDPGEWDDDMLWTMHVSADPYHPGEWRMFYTGLKMSERGRIQRVGLARSRDLYHWEKDESGRFPLEVAADFYEHSLDEGRHWISFRDPFAFHDNGHVFLLAAARVKEGPVIRRGCVALLEEVAENEFAFRPPLFHAMRYDDVEVPNVVHLDGRYYLIGSIREDVKVHYWYADDFHGPYRNFADNVLLPQGNYAARVACDGERYLVWNFFFQGLTTSGRHLMAPPKELVVDKRGELRLRSFAGFQDTISRTPDPTDLLPLESQFGNVHAVAENDVHGSFWIGADSGFEVFLLRGTYQDFILSGTLEMEGRGKSGLVLRLDENGDGYYLSLDLSKGVAQIRAWRHNSDGGIEEAFHYEQLQAAHHIPHDGPHAFSLIAYEQYLEFSLDGYVLLTLADDQCGAGRVGFYVESGRLRIDELQLSICNAPDSELFPMSFEGSE